MYDGDIAWTSKSRGVRSRTPLHVDISTWRNKFEIASVCKVWLFLGTRVKPNPTYDASSVTISGSFKFEIALHYNERVSPSGWIRFLRGNVPGYIQRISEEAAKFEITRGYTADISLNLAVLQGITTGLVRRSFVLRPQ